MREIEGAQVAAWGAGFGVSGQVGPGVDVDAFKAQVNAAYEAPPVLFSGPEDMFVNGRHFNILSTTRGLVHDSLHLMENYQLPEFFNGMARVASLQGGRKMPLVSGNNGVENHYHWIMQCLAAILAYKAFVQPSGGGLITQLLTPGRKDSLKVYDVGLDVQQIMPDQIATITGAIYCNLSGGAYTFAPHPEVLRLLREPVSRVRASRPFSKRLYVSRQDSGKRRMLNEADVCALMRGCGFEILETGKLSLKDQIAAFHGADIIVGPHGAAMTNILYCRAQAPRVKIVELLQENYLYACFAKIAQALGLDYTALVNPQAPLPRGVKQKTVDDTVWTADLDLLAATLDRL